MEGRFLFPYGHSSQDLDGQVFMNISSQARGDVSGGDTLHFPDVISNGVSSLY